MGWDPIELFLRWFPPLAKAFGLATLLFGAFSAARPATSIALYQRLMAWFNWRVEPLDAPREVRTTRGLGLVMVILSVALGWLVEVAGSPR